MMDREINLTRPSALVNAAAVAVIVASLAAVGAIFDIIPAQQSERPQSVPLRPQKSPETATTEQERSGVAYRDDDAGAAKGRTAQAMVIGCANCGVIEAVTAIRLPGQVSGDGALAGGVAGAAAGSQLSRGNGRTAWGLLGAVGGAYAGHAVERDVRSDTSYRVTVRMEDGTKRTVRASSAPSFAVGEKVRVVNGTIAAQS